MKNPLKIIYTTLLVLILWFALGLQFYISIEKNATMGWSALRSIIFVFSFYTIQTNLLIAVALSSILVWPNSAWGRFFSRVAVLTSIAVYILIVGLIYATLLAGTAKLQGLAILCDFLLHKVSPVMYIIFWFAFVPKQNIKWGQMLLWAIFPLLYLVYSLIRGVITGEYPYHFINVTQIGYPQVFINSFFVLLLFIALSAAFISISRIFAKTENK